MKWNKNKCFSLHLECFACNLKTGLAGPLSQKPSLDSLSLPKLCSTALEPRENHLPPPRRPQVVVIYCRQPGGQQQFGKYGSLYISLRFLVLYSTLLALCVCLCLKCNKFSAKSPKTGCKPASNRFVSLVFVFNY